MISFRFSLKMRELVSTCATMSLKECFSFMRFSSS